jgi:hypothetical protein
MIGVGAGWARLGTGDRMHWILVTVAVIALVALAGAGVAAITTGWLAPWGRRRVLRPTLWGYGAVVGAVGMALYMFLGPFRGPDLAMAPYAMSGMALFFVGLALQWAGQRPGRPTSLVTPDPR